MLACTSQAQMVIPLSQEIATGQLGISVRLGDNTNSYKYIIDTGSAGFFTAKGTNSYWDNTITGSILTNSFDISYGTGALSYQGYVARTKVTFIDVNGTPHAITDARMGVITNQPYPDWNHNINQSPPVAPEHPTNNLFFGTLGAGLYATADNASGGNLSSLLGQFSLTAGLTKGFIISTGGRNSTNATLTIGLVSGATNGFTLIPMQATQGVRTNDNGTTVNLYPEAQTTADIDIAKGATHYAVTNADIIMDTGGLGTHLTRGSDVPDLPAELLDGSQVVDGASFLTSTNGWAWSIDPTGSVQFSNKIAVEPPAGGRGSLNTGIALFYDYDVLFDTENGVIGLRAVPEPSIYALLALSAAGLGGYVLRRRKHAKGS